MNDRHLALAPALLLALVGACKGPSSQPPSAESSEGQAADERPATPPRERPSDALLAELDTAAAGVHDPELAELLEDHWRQRLTEAPSFAMRLGIHDFDGVWAPHGPEARMAQTERRRETIQRAKQLAEGGPLDDADRLSAALFVLELQSNLDREVCEFWAWTVSTRQNPLATIAGHAELVELETDADADALVQRYAGFAAHTDARIADLRDGLARGLVADADSVSRTLDMVERELATPSADSSLLGPVAELRADDPHRVELARLVDEAVRPALGRYAALLRDEIGPAARGAEQTGVGALPIGQDCYAALIQHHLSESPSADELHALGLAEIARIDDEFRALGKRALGTAKLGAVLERLRTDPELYFETAEEVEAFAAESLAKAEAAAPQWFGRLPQTPCVVQPIPAYEAPYTTIAYYRQPGEDEPGTYFINTHAPSSRPRYEARVLAIHEAVPGHHTQIAIAQELPDTPAFRRHGGTTVFVEGWALYTERLADEMGLYESDLDRLGVLSFDAWRASRLVVDTGIHAKGWTRDQAIAFMLEHTALAKNNIVNEVDRYVGWPGQALAYKYGQLEILRMRAEAEQALGSSFDIAAFHDVVLGAGALPMPILRQRVRAWVEATQSESK